MQVPRRTFEVLQMKENEGVDKYFARTLTVANKIKIHGEKMDQVVIIENILRSMTLKFDYVVCSMEESNNLDTLTIDELQSSLLVHEQRMKGHEQSSEEQALGKEPSFLTQAAQTICWETSSGLWTLMSNSSIQ